MKNPTLTPKLISQFEKAIGLTFINENEVAGNVCYANDATLRPDFKTTFTEKDLQNYILSLPKTRNITLPKDAATFWEIVDLGRVS